MNFGTQTGCLIFTFVLLLRESEIMFAKVVFGRKLGRLNCENRSVSCTRILTRIYEGPKTLSMYL